VISKGNKTYIIPQNKNVVLEGSNQYKVKYVSVYIPTAKRFFVSSEVENLIK